MITSAICILCLTLFNIAFAHDSPGLEDSRDGKTYSTTIIGSQTWMNENLPLNAGDGYYAFKYDDSDVKDRSYLSIF